MNKTSTYRGTSQRAGLGGNRYEGLYGMDLGDARWKSDSSSCSRNSALKGRVSRAYLISHYQSRLCFPYRRMSQTGWQIFSIMWEYLLFYIKFEGLRTGVAPRYLFIRPRRRSFVCAGDFIFRWESKSARARMAERESIMRKMNGFGMMAKRGTAAAMAAAMALTMAGWILIYNSRAHARIEACNQS